MLLYTSFLASKKLLRCFICQMPVTMRMSVWAMDHHRTRWLVLSLVMRKRSSRYCRDRRESEEGNEGLESSCVLLTDPLVVLLLLDLLHLVQQLAHSQLQLRQLVLSCDFRVVVGVFSHLNVQVDSLEDEESSAVSMRARAGGSETPTAFNSGTCSSSLWSPEETPFTDETCRSYDLHQGHAQHIRSMKQPDGLRAVTPEPSPTSFPPANRAILVELE